MRLRRITALGMVVLIGLATTACGQSSSSDAEPTSTTSAINTTTDNGVAGGDYEELDIGLAAVEHALDEVDSSLTGISEDTAAAWTEVRSQFRVLADQDSANLNPADVAADWESFQEKVAAFDDRAAAEQDPHVQQAWERVKSELDRMAHLFE